MKKYICLILTLGLFVTLAQADNIYNQPVKIKSNLIVTGNTSMQGVSATATTLTGTVTSSATIGSSGTLNQTGPLIASSSTTLSGLTTVANTMTATAPVIFNDTVNTNSAFVAAGANTISGLTTVGNTLTLNSSAPMISSSSVSIGSGSVADASSLIDITSTSKGVLLPRMNTTQRDAISSPATGLTIYNTTTSALNVYNGSAWVAVGSGGGSFTDSMVRLQDGNGHGSTNTKIRRFSTTVTNTGSDITYSDSATNGASFTINTSGVYCFSYTEEGNAGAPLFGLSLNSASLTTDLNAITESEILTLGNVGTGNDRKAQTWCGLLSASDVVRPHTNNGGGNSFVDNINNFTAVRVH